MEGAGETEGSAAEAGRLAGSRVAETEAPESRAPARPPVTEAGARVRPGEGVPVAIDRELRVARLLHELIDLMGRWVGAYCSARGLDQEMHWGRVAALIHRHALGRHVWAIVRHGTTGHDSAAFIERAFGARAGDILNMQREARSDDTLIGYLQELEASWR